MRRDILVSASILCADFLQLDKEIKKSEAAGCDMLHVDVMDGHFVPNITIGQVIIQAIRPITKLPIEVHLMIENPWLYIDSFIDAGADVISIHAECYGQRRVSCLDLGKFPKEVDSINLEKAKADILKIKQMGKKAFMAVNPGTPMCLDRLLKDLDGVLIMSVNPGFVKQKFIPEVLSKVQEVRKKFSGDIVIDGGINAVTAKPAVKAGANILVTASYFFSAVDPQGAVKVLKEG